MRHASAEGTMSDRPHQSNDTHAGDIGVSASHRRESFADPVTAVPDLPEQASVLAAGAVPRPLEPEPEEIVAQPTDQGGFGAHRPRGSKGDSADEGGSERDGERERR
jgi:hypothetical protein